jgi:hypothetical protein
MKKQNAEAGAPPVPYYPSRRLIGVELELDPGSAPYHAPQASAGWQAKGDLSIPRGQEWVLEPPLPIIEAYEPIDEFSNAMIKAKTHLSKKGGYHIHVQIHDYDVDDATRLVQLYWRFQEQIDLLVAPSRRSVPGNNTHVSPYLRDQRPTRESLIGIFHIDNCICRSRDEAKESRQKMVINLAMMRCRDPLKRSAEFRQPSPSKHTINIYGWACLAVGLVEIAKDATIANRYIRYSKPTWAVFLSLLRRVERRFGVERLVKWAAWRRDYLNGPVGEDKKHLLYGCLCEKPHGIFHIARKLNINILAAKKLVQHEVRSGMLVEDGNNKWRSRYETIATLDLKKILSTWEARENPPSTATAATPAAPAPTSNILVAPVPIPAPEPVPA